MRNLIVGSVVGFPSAVYILAYGNTAGLRPCFGASPEPDRPRMATGSTINKLHPQGRECLEAGSDLGLPWRVDGGAWREQLALKAC